MTGVRGFVLAHLTVVDGPEHGIKLIELYLCEVEIAQEALGKGPPLLRCLDQPSMPRVRIDLEPASRAPDAQALDQPCNDVDDGL